MKKLIVVSCLIATLVLPNIEVTYSARPDPIDELVLAENKINAVVLQSTKEELADLETVDTTSITVSEKNELESRKSRLRAIHNYGDINNSSSIDKTIVELRSKGYEVDKTFEKLCKEIEQYKDKNPQIDVKDIVLHFNSKYSPEDSKLSFGPITISVDSARAYSISYTTWTKLTTSEKLLVASSPTNAIITQSLQKKAFDFTSAKFGYNGLGDKSDGYRHGIWNALMTRDISRSWAEAIATAHEDRPKTELEAKQSDGYTGYQHKAMDLNNNKVGRGVIAWYEYSFNCSDATVKSRISAKLTNKSGGITWLHD